MSEAMEDFYKESKHEMSYEMLDFLLPDRRRKSVSERSETAVRQIFEKLDAGKLDIGVGGEAQ
ncbi:hypothetical protein SAMN05877838_3779 [Hoeflea halophila]|uniref:Uncharacterized protein n=1 Tax=Hoeflea halophila TaxID=714899 RepID=A0A286IFB7_9HYPH|nr:hypothetical protein [Hoeflea halophila]SOE18835.1 hypothetical protein SAMN05877838_3779 [Hoeflea halophila]